MMKVRICAVTPVLQLTRSETRMGQSSQVLFLLWLQMLLDPMGGIVMTNDGNAILREVSLA